MTKYFIHEAIIGLSTEIPQPDNPTGGVSDVATAMYIEADTGRIKLSTGQAWRVVGQLPLGTSLPGVASDGLTPPGVVVEGFVAGTWRGCLLVGNATIPGDRNTHPLLADGIRYASSDVTPTVASSLVTVNTPGWYRVHVWANLNSAGENNTSYDLLEGDSASYSAALGFGSSLILPLTSENSFSVIQSSGYYQFDSTFKTLQIGVANNGTVDQTFTYWISMEFLFAV